MPRMRQATKSANSTCGRRRTTRPETRFLTSFPPTDTGFAAAFNRVLSLGTAATPILNLYDAVPFALGPADVTLTGAVTGPIRGSLVVDPSNSRITFIQTGQTGIGA